MNIIITGASRGIGKELALYFANSGEHRVILISRNREKLEALCEKGDKGSLIPIVFDLEKDDIQLLSKKIRGYFSEIHILINNAGALINKKISQISPDDFDHMMNVNVKAAFFLSRALIPLFETNAHIVNIGSMGGVQGSAKFPGLSIYSASKGALAVLTECMAEELKEHKVAVNCLALGAAQTEMLADAFPGYKAPVTAQEMAAFIGDFSLNGNKYFNGKILPVSLSTP